MRHRGAVLGYSQRVKLLVVDRSVNGCCNHLRTNDEQVRGDWVPPAKASGGFEAPSWGAIE